MFYTILISFLTYLNSNAELMNELEISFAPQFIANICIAIVLIDLIAYIAFFVLRGCAFYKMAKNREINNAFFAFIPFLSIILGSKLHGDNKVFSKMKWSGLALAIIMAVDVAICIILDTQVIDSYMWLLEGNAFDIDLFIPEGVWYMMYLLHGLLNYAIIALSAVLCYGVFMTYLPERSALFLVISLIVDILYGTKLGYGIVLFVLKNKSQRNYDEFVANRMARRVNRSYYNNPNSFHSNQWNGGNNNTYWNNPNDGQGRNNYNGQNINRVEDPFNEFSDKKANNDPFDEFSNNQRNNNGGNDGDLFS